MLENSIYEELGVQTVIHAAGTKTTHGGTRSRKEVFDAMEIASKSFVSLEELNKRIGEYIASITGAEAGMVTSGAASGVVLSIAACMTGTDINKVRQLPNPKGMKNELIVQKIHVGSYAHMYTFTGARLIEVGSINDCLTEELEQSINENTVAINYLFGPRISRSGLSLKQVVKIAHNYGLPVIVDAAAILPPKEKLRELINEGADLVTISGGKMIHGPQNTGILYGKKELINAAMANSSPKHSIGRPHKVSKEAMVGLYVALKIFMDTDMEKMFKIYRKRLQPIFDRLNDLKTINLEIIHDQINYNVPVLAISFNENWKGPRPDNIPKIMLSETPRLFMQYFKELGHLVVNPVSLQDGEPEIVANLLAKFILKYQPPTFSGAKI